MIRSECGALLRRRVAKLGPPTKLTLISGGGEGRWAVDCFTVVLLLISVMIFSRKDKGITSFCQEFFCKVFSISAVSVDVSWSYNFSQNTKKIGRLLCHPLVCPFLNVNLPSSPCRISSKKSELRAVLPAKKLYKV